MRLRPLIGRSPAVYLDPDEYEQFLEVAKDQDERAYLGFRIAGECSPRVGRIVEIKRGDFVEPTDPDVEIILLKLTNTKDTSGDTEDGKARTTWVPRSLYEAIEQYCDRNDIGSDEPLFEIGAERLRGLIKAAGQEAADQFGIEAYKHITPQDGRRYYATTMLRRYDVKLEIVMDLGGWESRKAMKPYLDVYQPREIQDELARAGILEVDAPAPPRETELQRLHEEVRRLRKLVEADRKISKYDVNYREVAALDKDDWGQFKHWQEQLDDSDQKRVTDFLADTGLGAITTWARLGITQLRDEIRAVRYYGPRALEQARTEGDPVIASALFVPWLLAYGGLLNHLDALTIDPITGSVSVAPELVFVLVVGSCWIAYCSIGDLEVPTESSQ
ncbi:hypothetical protein CHINAEXTREME_20595 (plasmid) [Halobiforma lacisalsi AJ5]|uniref:Tyr recombinase domain-containing protein n=2 Tax=Natronobacterium lacisalsi TaxID=229731 RepID=M0LZ21_NATLA|nr:hypothetical protein CHINAEXTREME_20595 [Halobiforma lacisalsi AJ5]EMA37370.1 hypothetical protein C445_00736 [Halobiforma lacisalsi AJ5]